MLRSLDTKRLIERSIIARTRSQAAHYRFFTSRAEAARRAATHATDLEVTEIHNSIAVQYDTLAELSAK